ncbi:MAG: immunoglobulin-like domain-containing protein, partial [Patescibacteria group bacterium]
LHVLSLPLRCCAYLLNLLKNGLTIQGVDGSGNPITNRASVVATVKAIQRDASLGDTVITGDNVTISGLRFELANLPVGGNKNVFATGENFTLKNSVVDNIELGYSGLYLSDERGGVHVNNFSIQNNQFLYGEITITNGVGQTGPASGRNITGNLIEHITDWGAVSLMGMTGSGWTTQPIGDVTISGNTFNDNAFQIIARGSDYANPAGYWTGFLANNTFDKAVLTLTPDNDARMNAFERLGWVNDLTYESINYPLKEVYLRMIGTDIQESITRATAGDTIKVGTGTYIEQVNIDKELTVTGSGTSSTTIQAPDPSLMTVSDQSVYLAGSSSTRGKNKAIVRITASNVTFQNFHVTANNQILASFSSPYSGVGILVDHVGGATPVALTGILISNNLVDGENTLDALSAIKIIGQATVTVSGNTLRLNGSAFGVHILGLDRILPTGTYHPNVDVTNNIIYAGTTTRPIAGTFWNSLFYGIYYFFGANGTASGNTIYGAYGWGLNAWDAGDVNFTNNTVDTDGLASRSDRGHGSQLIGSSNRTSNLVFNNNKIRNKFYAALTSQNLPLVLTGQHNTITNTSDGFIFDRMSSGTFNINYNSFNVTGKAIAIGGTNGTPSGTGYGNWTGVSSISIDAQNNWWGSVSPDFTSVISGETVDYSNAITSSTPVITMNGPSELIIYVGSVYTDLGATASDPVDGDLTTSMVTNNIDNTDDPGDSTVTYDVTNAAGLAARVTRLVHVFPLEAQQVILDADTDLDSSHTEVVVGDNSEDATITIPESVTEPTINFAALLETSGDNKTVTTSAELTINSSTGDSGDVNVTLPAGLVITGDSGWDGILSAPTNKIAEYVLSGVNLSSVIEVGLAGQSLPRRA